MLLITLLIKFMAIHLSLSEKLDTNTKCDVDSLSPETTFHLMSIRQKFS